MNANVNFAMVINDPWNAGDIPRLPQYPNIYFIKPNLWFLLDEQKIGIMFWQDV